jgi:Recombinase
MGSRVRASVQAVIAPVGAIVKLYVDLVRKVEGGDFIETQTGRRYFVCAARIQTKGKHEGRQHLVCMVESCGAICDDLHDRGVPRPRGAWSRHRVWGIVRSRHPVGEWTADKRRKIVLSVPPIVDEALWQRANAALLRHKKRGLRRTKHVYLLEGLARCGLCGAAVLVRSATGGRNGRTNPAAYVCRQRKLAFRGLSRCGAKPLAGGLRAQAPEERATPLASYPTCNPAY